MGDQERSGPTYDAELTCQDGNCLNNYTPFTDDDGNRYCLTHGMNHDDRWEDKGGD